MSSLSVVEALDVLEDGSAERLVGQAWPPAVALGSGSYACTRPDTLLQLRVQVNVLALLLLERDGQSVGLLSGYRPGSPSVCDRQVIGVPVLRVECVLTPYAPDNQRAVCAGFAPGLEFRTLTLTREFRGNPASLVAVPGLDLLDRAGPQ